jgi:hypothetical protein
MRSTLDLIPPFPRRRARAASVVLALGGVLGMGGCETTPTTTGSSPAGGGDLAASSSARGPGSDVPIDEIKDDGLRALRVRDQAERDLDDLLKLRQERKSSAVADAAAMGTDPVTPDPVTRVSPTVVWNSPALDRAADAAAASKPAVKQPPLGMADEVTLKKGVVAAAGSPAEATTTGVAGDEQLHLLLVDVRRALNMRMAYSDQPLRELIAIAMQSIINPDVELNPDAFNGITDEERELLRQLQTFFSTLGRELDGSVEAREALVRAVAELQSSLVVEPELELPTVALCFKVIGFGDYKVFDRSAFLAHNEQRVILYIEIDRFTSEQNPKQQWVTEVSQQLEIYADADGIPVWSEEWHKAVDVSNNERRDFFTTQLISLPQALSVGRYHLKIRVRDEKSGALAESSIAFEMVADPKRAATMVE